MPGMGDFTHNMRHVLNVDFNVDQLFTRKEFTDALMERDWYSVKNNSSSSEYKQVDSFLGEAKLHDHIAREGKIGTPRRVAYRKKNNYLWNTIDLTQAKYPVKGKDLKALEIADSVEDNIAFPSYPPTQEENRQSETIPVRDYEALGRWMFDHYHLIKDEYGNLEDQVSILEERCEDLEKRNQRLFEDTFKHEDLKKIIHDKDNEIEKLKKLYKKSIKQLDQIIEIMNKGF